MVYAQRMDSLSRQLPPLQAMLAFEAAARYGSFTAAAAELNVSQPAISRRVRALEDALGIALFIREHRSVTLTAEGEVYFKAIGLAFNNILETGRAISQTKISDRVTIYANYGLASYWLLPRLVKFQTDNPDVDIVLKTVSKERPLSTRKPEISIRFGSGQWDDGDSQLLFRETAFPLCSPGYLEGKPAINSVEDLKQHKLLQIQTHNHPWLSWTNFFKSFDITYIGNNGPAYNNYTLAIQAALAGQGMIIGWEQIADDFINRGWLVRPIKEQISTDSGYYIVTNSEVRSSANLEKVVTWLYSLRTK